VPIGRGNAAAAAVIMVINMGISQLLRKAEVKREEQERKRRHAQQEVIQSTRTMVDVGNFGAATMILQNALETQLFSESDPRLVEMRHEIDEKQAARPIVAPASASGAVAPPSGGAPWTDPSGDAGNDYVYQSSASTHDVPVAPSPDAAESAIFSATSVTGPAIQPHPPPAPLMEPKAQPKPGKSTKRGRAITPPDEFSATKVIQSTTDQPAASSPATEITSQPEIAPIRHLPSSTPVHATVPGRKRATPVALYVLSGEAGLARSQRK